MSDQQWIAEDTNQHDNGNSDQRPWSPPAVIDRVRRQWAQLDRDWQAVVCGILVVTLVMSGVGIPW